MRTIIRGIIIVYYLFSELINKISIFKSTTMITYLYIDFRIRSHSVDHIQETEAFPHLQVLIFKDIRLDIKCWDSLMKTILKIKNLKGTMIIFIHNQPYIYYWILYLIQRIQNIEYRSIDDEILSILYSIFFLLLSSITLPRNPLRPGLWTLIRDILSPIRSIGSFSQLSTIFHCNIP